VYLKSCPNCAKKLNDNYTFCWECGCNLNSGDLGDFKTGLLNVFKNNQEFIYIYSVHGKQVILKASSIEELRMLVEANKFPWMETEGIGEYP